jgi:trypsin
MSRKKWALRATACALVLGGVTVFTPIASSALAKGSPNATARKRSLADIRFRGALRATGHARTSPNQLEQGSDRPRIIGGYGAAPGDWGFMAFVAYFDADGNPEFACSGTVVAPNVVLTAGHCTVDETTGAALAPSGYRVVTGSLDWTNPSERQISDVSQVITDPLYDRATATSDAGLLVLSSPTNAPAIPLATSAEEYLDQPGTGAGIAGWGATYDGGPVVNYLEWAPIVVQGSGYCSSVDALFDSSSQLCAVNPPDFSTGTCNGDSGGPLVADNAADQTVEIGLTSQGPADCDTYRADIFTDVIPISSWVAGWVQAVQPAPTPPPAPAPPSTTPAPPQSQPSAPAPLPTLTIAAAKRDVRVTLAAALERRFKPAHDYATKCSPKSSTRVACGVTFWNGPNDYYGSVTIYYVAAPQGNATWADTYTIHWVNDECEFHSAHPQRCHVQTRRGRS